jgi:hypothetical protein
LSLTSADIQRNGSGFIADGRVNPVNSLINEGGVEHGRRSQTGREVRRA